LMISFIMGAAFGEQGGDASPISEIPLLLVNADEGGLGANFADTLLEIEVDTTDGAKPLFAITETDDKTAAIEQVELGETRGVVYLPPDFSANLEAGTGEDAERQTSLVEIYTDPAATISPGIIRGVVTRIATGFSTVVIGNTVAVNQLLDVVTDIPVLFVNDDPGPVSDALTEAFSPENFEGLFVITVMDDYDEAQAKLDAGEAAALIHVTDGFSQAVMTGADGETVAGTLAVYRAPDSLAAPIVEEFALNLARGFGADADPSREAETPEILANLENLEDILNEENTSFAETEGPRDRITVTASTVGAAEELDLLNYFVPSMAIFFLMFAVFDGTRSILEEERDGTLHRLMTTPTSIANILLGKIGGTFLTGILQFVVLVLASWVFFRVNWGRAPLGIILMMLATVAAATSLGAFVASFARNVNQAGVLGTAITLVFAILGGNFIDFRALPGWLAVFSKMTINRWALEGFVNLTLNGMETSAVLPHVGVLFGMAAVFFGLAVALFNRRFVK
ncbi:MAG: ABC transporter permease, partial [Anaerolineales bacterium]